MGLFLAIILGYFVVENIKDNSDNITKEVKKTQVERSIIVEKKSSVIKVEPELQKLESIEEVVNPELKKPDLIEEKNKPSIPEPEPIKDEPNPLLKEPEPIKDEPKPLLKEPEPIKDEPKPLLKEPEPINDEIKPNPNREEAEAIVSSDKQGTSWLKLFLYILGPILILIIGRNFYTRLKVNSSQNGSSNDMKNEFKKEAQTDTSESQSTQEEAQTDTSESQSTQEDDNNKQ